MEIPDGTPDNTVKISLTIPTTFHSHTSPYVFSRSRLTHDSLLLPQPRGNSPPPSVSSNSMSSLMFEGVFLWNIKSKIFFELQVCLVVLSRQGRTQTNEPRLLPTTVAATKIAHPSDARGQLHVSRPLCAQLSRPFYPSSLASYRTLTKHCWSPEHEQHFFVEMYSP